MSVRDELFEALKAAHPTDKAGILSIAQETLSGNDYVQFASWLEVNLSIVLGLIK